MSAQNDFLRSEMEVNPRFQNGIVAHHILQVVSAVVICIFISYEAELTSFLLLLMILILFNVPTVLFIIFWIASKCSYQDLCLILVHFNPCLSALWFLVFFPCCIRYLRFIDGMVTGVLFIITCFLSLSSAMFATYGIWKSARNVVLSSRRVKREDYDVPASLPPTVESPDMYTDINVQRLSQASYIHPI